MVKKTRWYGEEGENRGEKLILLVSRECDSWSGEEREDELGERKCLDEAANWRRNKLWEQ